MGELDAVGDAVTGGVLGAAVEPAAGKAGGHTHEPNCLNCGAELSGPYCHECGQHAHVHRTLSSFFHDFLHGALHFEGKIWRTLPLLAWKPGELTRRYIDGQRASFISPIALFLFCVFLTFAVMGLTGTKFGQVSGTASKNIAEELRADELALPQLQNRRAAAAKAGVPTAELDAAIKDLQAEIAALRLLNNGNIGVEAFNPQGARDRGAKLKTFDLRTQGLPNWLRQPAERAKENPELLFYKLKTNAYKFSWALIPISVPFVWLLFPFSRRFRMYDHTVFVTYSLCFMMLLLVAGTLIGVVSEAVASIAWFVPPIHLYRQVRGAYGVGRIGALWRTVALTIFAFIAIGLFASLLLTLGAFD